MPLEPLRQGNVLHQWQLGVAIKALEQPRGERRSPDRRWQCRSAASASSSSARRLAAVAGGRRCARRSVPRRHRWQSRCQCDEFDWNCDYYLKHGRACCRIDWKERIGQHDAIFFGAVGWPAKVPDHMSLWGSLLKFRREFDQYVNLRPVRLMPGIPTPLSGRQVGDIDFYVVRENTEGEYSSIGGRIFEGTEQETVIQESIFTRRGVDRIIRFAFELARRDRRNI
jgi:isocitrate/isopropylmalate dehydrogenase